MAQMSKDALLQLVREWIEDEKDDRATAKLTIEKGVRFVNGENTGTWLFTLKTEKTQAHTLA